MSEPLSIITSHVNSDFDAIASMLAAQKLYPDAKVVFPGSSEKNSRDFFVNSMVYLFNMDSIKSIDLKQINRLILVDTRQSSRIGPFAEILDQPGLEIHIYDHHPASENDIVGSYEKCRVTGANVTILTEIIKDKNIDLTEEEATILCLGLYEDTGSFSYLSTTPEDMMAGAWLLSKGANLDTVSNMLSREITQQQVGLLNDMIHSIERHHINGVEIMITTVSSEDYVAEMALVVQKLMKIESPNALFVLARMGSKIYLIARSKISEVDTGSVIRAFGGGGHATAASATIKDQALPQLKRKLIDTLYLKVHSRLASALMSSPAYTIAENNSISDAETLLNKYNINALVVTQNIENKEQLMGIISRQVVQKALHHNLEKVDVREYMSSELESISSDADLATIQERWIGSQQRLLPVIDKGNVVGVITRTDLFNVLINHTGVLPDQSRENTYASARTRKVTQIMQERLPERILTILKDIGEIAESMSCNTFLVGGFVRDLLLSRKNEDIDIVVEGDGIQFAKQYAKKARARVHAHEKFGTAVVIFPDRFKVDVATARTEHYASPAAMPTVEQSSIKLDLYRRDFTINTLVIQLNGDKFGTLIDFFGAYQDIKEKVVRVLHNLSMVEDPSRVFRAIRFEQRFGFQIGKLTDHLVKNAVRMNFVKQLGGRRVFTELRLILQEDDPMPAVRRMQEYGILQMIHEDIHFNPKMIKRFGTIKKVLAWHELQFIDTSYLKWAVYFMGLTHDLPSEINLKICQYFDIASQYHSMLCKEKTKALRILRALESSKELVKNSELYHSLKHFKIEVLLYMMATASKKIVIRQLSNYYSHLKYVKPYISGKDLKEMGLPPGPFFSQILSDVLNARLDGMLETREDEVEYVKNFIAREKKPDNSQEKK